MCVHIVKYLIPCLVLNQSFKCPVIGLIKKPELSLFRIVTSGVAKIVWAVAIGAQ